MTSLRLNLGSHSYDITIGHGLLSRAGELFRLDRRVLVVTDEGVPEEYAKRVADCAKEAKILTLPMGEGTKSFDGMQAVLSAMCEFGMTRRDAVVAVGGGVIGDLTGYAASSYMRGIDFYNVPTTLLADVDSSIGGKCAINFSGIKNIVGAFYQPKGVIVDVDCLATLPKRHIANGLAEAIKMSLTSDGELFSRLERYTEEEILENIEDIIISALKIKRAVVECDEREGGVRKILNFGHTLGHGIEAREEMRGFYHGECVALGMLPLSAPDVRARLIPVLNKVGLPTSYEGDIEEALGFVMHDKKRTESGIDIIEVVAVGEYRITNMTTDQFRAKVLEVY